MAFRFRAKTEQLERSQRLSAKARIWPSLSYLCHICLTVVRSDPCTVFLGGVVFVSGRVFGGPCLIETGKGPQVWEPLFDKDTWAYRYRANTAHQKVKARLWPLVSKRKTASLFEKVVCYKATSWYGGRKNSQPHKVLSNSTDRTLQHERWNVDVSNEHRLARLLRMPLPLPGFNLVSTPPPSGLCQCGSEVSVTLRVERSAGTNKQALVNHLFCTILTPRHPSHTHRAPKETPHTKAPGLRWASGCEDCWARHRIVQRRFWRFRR